MTRGAGAGHGSDVDDTTPLLGGGGGGGSSASTAEEGGISSSSSSSASSSSSSAVAPMPPAHLASTHSSEDDPHATAAAPLSKWTRRLRVTKTALLSVLLLMAAVFFCTEEEQTTLTPVYAASRAFPLSVPLEGAEQTAPFSYYRAELTAYSAEAALNDSTVLLQLSGRWEERWHVLDVLTVDVSPTSLPAGDAAHHTFDATTIPDGVRPTAMAFNVTTTSERPLSLALSLKGLPYAARYQEVYAFLILVGVYVLIVFELVHRMLAAMLGSFLTLGVLSLLRQRPSLDVIVGWIDFETVCLLFGMMLMVGIFAQTGFFEWAAVRGYKLSRGSVWRLVTLLCAFAAVVSAFLDNVTTVLLLTPVTIRLCRVLNLDPKPILIAEVIFSNIGGTATAVGDPPNVIIVSNAAISRAGIDFSEFTLHMLLGVLLVAACCYVALALMFRRIPLELAEPAECAGLRREIQVWCRAANRLAGGTAEEATVKRLLTDKVESLSEAHDKRMREYDQRRQAPDVAELERTYRIHDVPLFIKSCVVLGTVIIMFFLHSIPQVHLDLGWISLLGAMSLVLVADLQNVEGLLEKIEWGTLLFFAALFILMEGLGELGLIDFIGDGVVALIRAVPEGARLAAALLVILWVSALCSSFIDNIPFTTAMIPVVVALSEDAELGLPLRPLVWALAMGACLGGNGTLIGASANVVCAGLAEQHGHPISFNDFFKLGFPIMLVSIVAASIYLILCHVVGDWNG